MKASWASLVWYSLLILTFVIAVARVVLDTGRRKKGGPPGRLDKARNRRAVVFSRIGTEMKRFLPPPGETDGA